MFMLVDTFSTSSSCLYHSSNPFFRYFYFCSTCAVSYFCSCCGSWSASWTCFSCACFFCVCSCCGFLSASWTCFFCACSWTVFWICSSFRVPDSLIATSSLTLRVSGTGFSSSSFCALPYHHHPHPIRCLPRVFETSTFSSFPFSSSSSSFSLNLRVFWTAIVSACWIRVFGSVYCCRHNTVVNASSSRCALPKRPVPGIYAHYRTYCVLYCFVYFVYGVLFNRCLPDLHCIPYHTI